MKVFLFLTLLGLAMAARLTATEEEVIVQPPKPYNFGFEVRDDDTTNYQNRAEASDSEGRVRGSYSYVLPDGYVYTVTYEDNRDGMGLKSVVRKEPSGIDVIIPEPYLQRINPKKPVQNV